MKINYIEKGAGDKYAVLLHGWSGSSLSLAKLQDKLSGYGYHTYNLDLPGFGGTALPEKPYYLDNYVLTIKQFIIEHKIEKPLLIGHSFGGKIGLKMAVEDSDLLGGLVAVSASGIKPNNSLKKNVLARLSKAGKKFTNPQDEGAFATTARKLFYKFVVREKDYYKSGALKQTFVNIVEEHLDENLKEITLPVLIVWGERDTVTPVWMGYKMKELINNSSLEVVPNTKHNLPLLYPEIVAEIIYNKFK